MLGMQRTINSLKQLQRHEFQWVCIDSNSNDGSVELAQQFKITSDVVISEADTGIYNAMNKGVLQAIGTHLLFLNSGDSLASSITSVDVLKLKNQVDLILFGFQIRNQLRLPRPNAWRFWSMPTSHQAIIYSKEVLISEPFDETYRFAADFEHYLRINRTPLRIDRNNRILIVNEPYGSDAHLPRLLAEYRHALIKNGYPWVWAQGVYWLKKFYLNFALR